MSKILSVDYKYRNLDYSYTQDLNDTVQLNFESDDHPMNWNGKIKIHGKSSISRIELFCDNNIIIKDSIKIELINMRCLTQGLSISSVYNQVEEWLNYHTK